MSDAEDTEARYVGELVVTTAEERADLIHFARGGQPLARRGRVEVDMTDGTMDVSFRNWFGDPPRTGDRFQIAIYPAPEPPPDA